MTRLVFMERLRSLLGTLPFSEQQEALRYYEEYFNDAGPENEQHVIEELGSPEQVAQTILNSNASSLTNSSNAPTAQTAPTARKKTGLWIFLACTAIIWGPVLFGVVITIVVTLFAVFIGLFAAALGILATAVAAMVMFFAALIIGVPLVFSDSLNGLLLISMALFCVGILLTGGSLSWGLFRYVIPGFVRFCGKLFKRFSGRKTKKEELK